MTDVSLCDANIDNPITALTLQYLTNCNIDSSPIERNHINMDDYKFYRKRLQNLFRERMQAVTLNEHDSEFIVIDDLIGKFIVEGTKVFKNLDFNELKRDELLNTSTEIENVPYQSLEDCNKLLYVDIKCQPKRTMDEFIIKKNELETTKMTYPSTEQYNLKEDRFKKKGIVRRGKKDKNK